MGRDHPLPQAEDALPLLQAAVEAIHAPDPELRGILREFEVALAILQRQDRRDPVEGQQRG